jgi:hypothetical protein
MHTVNIVSDGGKDQNFLPLYDDLLDDKLIVTKGKNNFIHFNNMTAIKIIPDYNEYDVFIKMDDDDVYKKNYVFNIVKFFENNPDVDIVSTKINHQLNGNQVITSENGYDNLGGNPNNSTYHMPMTHAFNKKALECIVNTHPTNWNDDFMWRCKWEQNNLKHLAVDNREQVIWHIHGNNISTSSFLSK